MPSIRSVPSLTDDIVHVWLASSGDLTPYVLADLSEVERRRFDFYLPGRLRSLFAVGASIFLLFFVIDAMIVNRRFIDRIMAADVAWPASLVERWCEATSEDARLCARRFLAVRLVAERTSVVIDLIYYPFVVLLLMIFSRVHYFDNWDWPLGLLAVLGLNAAGAVFAGFTLRSAAENGRRRALAELSEKLFAAAVGRSGDPAERDREALEFGIEAIERRKDGAFSSFAENPVLRALLLPSGGFGLIALAQLFPAFH